MPSCKPDLDDNGSLAGHGGEMQLSFIASRMNVQQVSTRSSVKKPEEQTIKTLHIFIFGPDGQYLSSKEGYPFQGYVSLPENSSTFIVNKEIFQDPIAASNASVYAVANFEPGSLGNITPEGYPEKITQKSDLDNFIYQPLQPTPIDRIPSSGLPMFGKKDNINLMQDQGNTQISLKSLMARVDINLEIVSSNSDAQTGQYPSLTMTSFSIRNAPSFARLIPTGNTTDLDMDEDGKPDTVTHTINTIKTIYNRTGSINLSLYVFENIQQPAISSNSFPYPDGITDDEKQKYKPELAHRDKAMSFLLKGIYTTYNYLNYNVSYELFLGNNHTDNFEVQRNRQYINNVTVQGITNRNGNDGEVTFDARVNVDYTSGYYLSMLRERNFDAHFNVTPLDIYILDPNSNGSIDISIDEPETNNWFRIEYVSAETMRANRFLAGTGKRDYFTYDLVTQTLRNNTSYTGLKNRDRIYFYVDENASVLDRTGSFTVRYKEGDKIIEEKRVTIEQRGLLRVIVEPDHWIYAEYYEEYLNHYDPYENINAPQVFTEGLPWGISGNLGFNGWNSNAWENYYDGQSWTPTIVNMNRTDMKSLTLNGKPSYAADYCYNKNKRNADGSVYTSSNGYADWFLPAIRQLEKITKTYYSQFPEFQNFFYWSAAAAGRKIGLVVIENQDRARATKATLQNGNISHINSGYDEYYDPSAGTASTGGNALRSQVFRIRACRTSVGVYDPERPF